MGWIVWPDELVSVGLELTRRYNYVGVSESDISYDALVRIVAICIHNFICRNVQRNGISDVPSDAWVGLGKLKKL